MKIAINFISTSTGDRPSNVITLINSIIALTIPDNVRVNFIFVDQAPDIHSHFFWDINWDKINNLIIKLDETIPLSVARNKALSKAENGLVLFCDDDAVYPSNFLDTLLSSITPGNLDHIYVFSVINLENGLPYGGRKYPISTTKLSIHQSIQLGVSLGLCVHLKHIQTVNGFDERLGAGTEYGSGEESDLVIRLICSGLSAIFIPDLYTQHPQFKNEADNYTKVEKYAIGYSVFCMRRYSNITIRVQLKIHLTALFIRSLGGLVLTRQAIYFYRLKGLIIGVNKALKGKGL